MGGIGGGGGYGGSGMTALSDDASYQMLASNSLSPNATTAAFDDYFAYNLADPITIRKNESALVPILQTKIDAERVTLWSQREPTPLRALWITNTSNLTLDRGSFSIVEDGNFGGEGLLDPIHPNEKRLLSYAVDQAVRVTTESNSNSTRVTSITASKGVLVLRNTQVSEITYVVRNAAPEARTVVVEHAVRNGYTIDSTPKPFETTPSVYRFRVATAIQPILAARRHQADMQTALDKVNTRLAGLKSDEERQRSNVTALATADKPSRDRFVHDLNATEDQIAAAQKDLTAAQIALQAAKDDLAAKIESIQLDEKL